VECETGKIQYYSVQEARRQAHQNADHGREDRYFYQCPRCFMWHLTRQSNYMNFWWQREGKPWWVKRQEAVR